MIIKSRFPGTCLRCKQRFEEGTRIDWTQGVGAMHVLCPEAAPQLTPPAPAVPAPRQAVPVIIEVPQIRDFLTKAARTLKQPRMRFLGPDGRSELRIGLAGPAARFPGELQVKLDERWLGGVSLDNVVSGMLRHMPEVLRELRVIEGNPLEAAKRYGALMSRCSFCGLALTDAGSVEMGYGPICAMNYELPHIAYGVPEVFVPKDHA